MHATSLVIIPFFLQAIIPVTCSTRRRPVELETLQRRTLMSFPVTDDIMALFLSRRRSICNVDDSVEAKCYEDLEEVYTHAKAVLRIRKDGKAHCTGWLVGDEGHILTNHHCIASQEDANSRQFEALAEGASCHTSCESTLACPGVYVHSEPVTFIATGGNRQNDWTLLQLRAEDRAPAVTSFGFLQLRASGPVVGEAIYIPQHPRGWGKKIAMHDGLNAATIIDTHTNQGCSGEHEVAYRADTQGGSSGSPVLSLKDHAVIALHHCGGCDLNFNTAVHMDSLMTRMNDLLPNSAFTTSRCDRLFKKWVSKIKQIFTDILKKTPFLGW